MLKNKSFRVIYVALFIFLLQGVSEADVLVYALDTSGSMKNHGFEDAKDVLVEQIKAGEPGDVIHIIAFDTNDYFLGKVEVGEGGGKEDKEALIKKVMGLKPKGLYTNIDEALQSAKALLLEERTPGIRKIIVLSDGISDPSPGHEKVDIKAISKIIPQELGWSVYIVGLSDDIAGLFQQNSRTKGIVVNPEIPHVKGVPIEEFSREKIDEAVDIAKEDRPSPLENAIPVLPWLIGAGVLVIISIAYLLLNKKKSEVNLIFEVTDKDGKTLHHPLLIREGNKKTVGPRGEIPVEMEGIPPVVFYLTLQKELLWLTPLDAITLNGKPVGQKTTVNFGDVLSVRGVIKIIINQGGDE